MKKLLLTILFASLITTAAFGADFKVFINKIELETPIPPEIKNGYTFLPLRPIAEALGFAIKYDPVGQTIVLEKSGTVIQMTIGKTDVTVNGETFSLPAEPYVSENYTLAPLSFMAEAAGARAEWIPEAGAFIYSDFAMPLKTGNGSAAAAFYENVLENAIYSIYIPEFYETGSQVLTNALNERLREYAQNIIDAAQTHGSATLIQNATYEIFDGEKYLSVLSINEKYDGGAHGTYTETALTADIVAGKIISLADLFAEGFDYKEFLLSYLKENWPNNPKYSEDYPLETFTPENFYVKDDTLVIFYQPYEMGSYAVGTVKFEIPLKNLEAIE
jgi:hypothetical protein